MHASQVRGHVQHLARARVGLLLCQSRSQGILKHCQRMPKAQWYGVRVGREGPRVYSSWTEVGVFLSLKYNRSRRVWIVFLQCESHFRVAVVPSDISCSLTAFRIRNSKDLCPRKRPRVGWRKAYCIPLVTQLVT